MKEVRRGTRDRSGPLGAVIRVRASRPWWISRGARVDREHVHRPRKPIILDIDPFETGEGGRVLESSIEWRIPGPRARRHRRPKQPAMDDAWRGILKPPSRTTRHETPWERK